MFARLFSFFSSLWLTVVLLSLALILVFVGTIAQVKLGLYMAQAEYFRSLFVYWKPDGASFKIPVFPGGWLLGGLLLVNLLAAHFKRFQFSKKKIGIFFTHFGLILLLAGQFLTEVFQVESTMRMAEGEARNYAEDSKKNELVIIDTTDSASNKVVSIPESIVARQKEIRHPELPFTIRIRNYHANSDPVGPMAPGNNKISASDGIGSSISFAPTKTTTVMDDEDKPTAHVEIADDKGTKLGDWAVSIWLSRYPCPENLKASDKITPEVRAKIDEKQTFTHNSHTYEIALRPVRYYKPYTLTLLDFTHDKYPGTEIPKNFSSKVHLVDPSRGEERDILIYMNNPLRYRGETFFQSAFLPGDTGTILQVVDNPAAITPYVSCTLVGLGLTVQFLMHLINFGRKPRNQTPGRKPGVKDQPQDKEEAPLTPEAVMQRRIS